MEGGSDPGTAVDEDTPNPSIAAAGQGARTRPAANPSLGRQQRPSPMTAATGGELVLQITFNALSELRPCNSL